MTPETFFAAERGKPFVWGATDCGSTVDRWIRQARGASAMEAGRTSFVDEAQAAGMLKRTGLVRLFAKSMKALGLRKADEPKPGDVAVLRIGPWAVCAVRGERMWLFRTERGISAASPDVKVLTAWSLSE